MTVAVRALPVLAVVVTLIVPFPEPDDGDTVAQDVELTADQSVLEVTVTD
jgi:hypothetical protein